MADRLVFVRHCALSGLAKAKSILMRDAAMLTDHCSSSNVERMSNSSSRLVLALGVAVGVGVGVGVAVEEAGEVGYGAGSSVSVTLGVDSVKPQATTASNPMARKENQ